MLHAQTVNLADGPKNGFKALGTRVKKEGIIIRKQNRDNLQIGWDEEDGFVLLFTPDMANTGNHYHIGLAEDEAMQLCSFLNKKLVELSEPKVVK